MSKLENTINVDEVVVSPVFKALNDLSSPLIAL